MYPDIKMLNLQIFSIECLSTNLNWENKNINIFPTSEHIFLSISHYETNINISQINTKNFNCFTKFAIIKEHWQDNIETYSQILNIDLNKYVLDKDYVLAPIIIKKLDLYIGIFVINKELIKLINNQYSNQYSKVNKTKYGFLSTIRPLENVREKDLNKFNIFNGIINYRNKTVFGHNYTFIDQTINKFITIENELLPMAYIIKNARNYMPKFDIKFNKLNNSTVFFQTHPNP